MNKISAIVTTFNNQLTLENTIRSVQWADEIIVLDSFSNDETLNIAEMYGAKIFQHEFLEWVLLLDADEEVTISLQKEIQNLLAGSPKHDGYKLPRQEQLFWQMSKPRASYNYQLRLFRRTVGRLSKDAVHSDPEVEGSVGKLHSPFLHYGEANIHSKVARVNAYSTGMVSEKVEKGYRYPLIMCCFYPWWTFMRSYFFKYGFLNGSAGFIGSVIMAHYSFLKYAKLHEFYQVKKYGISLLPPGCPDNLHPPEVPK